MGWFGEIAAIALASVLAITLHEAAHGYAARALGDDTAERLGRLSLNPLRHVDPVGTVLVPGFLAFSQVVGPWLAGGGFGSVQAMFGWAKPVPVDFWRLRDPRWGMVLVAAAGPAVNFALALGFGLAAHGIVALDESLPPALLDWLVRFVALSMLVNVILACFNLLPIPPLDGGRILVGILPAPLARAVARLERVGLLLVMGVLLLPLAVEGFDPLGGFIRSVALPVLRLIFDVTGHGGPA